MQRGHERSFWSYPCGHGRIHVYMSYTRSQSNFGSWDILHVKHFWRCIVSAVCVANQETSWIAAGAGARRAKTLNVLKGLFLHLSRHGHGMPPHVCVFDLLILCRPALMLNGGTCGHSQIRLARLDMEDMKKKPKCHLIFRHVWLQCLRVSFFHMASSWPADLLGVDSKLQHDWIETSSDCVGGQSAPKSHLVIDKDARVQFRVSMNYERTRFTHFYTCSWIVLYILILMRVSSHLCRTNRNKSVVQPTS